MELIARRDATHPAPFAFAAFLTFVIAVNASASQLVPALAPLSPGKSLIALALAGLAWSVVLCRRPLRLGLGAGGGALYLFFAVVVASPVWSLWPRLSFDAAAESVKYLAAFFLAANLLDSRERVRRAAAFVAGASLIPAIGAIQSYLRGVNLVEGTRAAWIGVYGNPNFLAYHLVVAVPLCLALRDDLAARVDVRARALRRALWLAGASVLAVAILLTGSRGGALGLAAVLLFWLLRNLARGRVALGAAATLFLAVALAPGGPWDRAETATTLAGEVDASAQGRIDAWRTAERILAHRPLGGVGAGAFVLGYERYAPGDAGPARTAHNSFLLVAAEVGIPALILFVAAIALAFRAMGRTAWRPDGVGALARGAQAALVGFAVCSLTGSYAFTWPLTLVLGLAAGIHAAGRAPAGEAA